MNLAHQNSSYGSPNLSTYLEQKTLAATPVELVAMMYAKAISELQEARAQLAAGNIALRSRAISRACDLIGELDGSLNMEIGGDLSTRLRSLYRYSLIRLLEANVQQADAPIAEVIGLLVTLSEGWQAVARSESVPERAAPVRWESEATATGHAHSWTL